MAYNTTQSILKSMTKIKGGDFSFDSLVNKLLHLLVIHKNV